MSTPTETPPPPAGEPVTETCPRCGAPLRPDQEWCLNCGAAVRTEVAGAPAWRAPIAIVGAVLLIAAIALVIAFVKLSDDSEQVAQAPAPTANPAESAPAPSPAPTTAPPVTGATPTPSATLPAVPGASATPDGSVNPGATTAPLPGTGTGTTGGEFSDWPGGTSYTVILWSATTRAEAETKATAFQGAGMSVGILHSDDYSSLNPGYWVVFSGQYADASAASDAAEAAQSTAPGAYPRHVKPK